MVRSQSSRLRSARSSVSRAKMAFRANLRIGRSGIYKCQTATRAALEVEPDQPAPEPGTPRIDSALSVRRIALPPVPGRQAVALAESPTEMREIVETPGERDFSDVTMQVRRRREIALAMFEPLLQHVALERGVFVGEQAVDVAR